ncbi:MAG: hypothetical protein WBH03_07245, partial [Cyclobacteriaceae bacterium]
MKLANYVTAGLAALLMYACHPYEEVVPEAPIPQQISPIERTRIDPASEQGLMNKLHGMLALKPTAGGRTMNSAVGELVTERATKVTDHRKGIKRYTFLLENDGSTINTRNLVLREDAAGELSAYTVTYAPDMDWVLATEGNMQMDEYTGRVYFRTLEGFLFYYLDMENGTGTLYGHKLRGDVDARIMCGGGTGDDGGSGGSTTDPGDDYEPIGVGDFGDYPDPLPESDPDPSGSDGGTSGGNTGGGAPAPLPDEDGGSKELLPVISIRPIEDAERKENVLRMACEVPEQPEECNSETNDCEGEPIGMDADDRSPYEYLADRWEEEICLKENFAANECVNGIWNIMKEHNVGYELLNRFTGDQPVAALCLDI